MLSEQPGFRVQGSRFRVRVKKTDIRRAALAL
jgi:hypothetical protein